MRSSLLVSSSLAAGLFLSAPLAFAQPAPSVTATAPVAPAATGNQTLQPAAGDEGQVIRLGRALDDLAEEQRRAQRIGSMVSLGVGAVVTTAGVVLVARGDNVGDESRTSRGFVLGFGIGGVVAGGLGLFLRTPFERLRDEHRAEVGRSGSAASVLATTERRWEEMADRERTGRMIGGTVLAVGAAAGLGIGGFYALRDDTGGREANERRAAAGLISAGFLASGAAFLFTVAGSSERALRTYRDASGRPVSAPTTGSLRLGGGPMAGGGVMTLGGAF